MPAVRQAVPMVQADAPFVSEDANGRQQMLSRRAFLRGAGAAPA